MPLPKHVKLDACLPDATRAGHIYHPPTEEVFSVDPDTYQQVVDAQPDQPEYDGELDADGEPVETPAPQRSMEELQQMAADLQLGLPPDADRETLESAIETALAGNGEAAAKAKRRAR